MSELFYRELEEEDDACIAEVFSDYYIKNREKKKWMERYNEENLPDFLYKLIAQENDIIVRIVCEKYLVVCQVMEYWHTDKRFIEELLVMKLYDNNYGFEYVIEFFEEIAEVYECEGIIVSTDMAHSDEALAKVYEKFGYTRDAIKLHKMLDKE